MADRKDKKMLEVREEIASIKSINSSEGSQFTDDEDDGFVILSLRNDELVDEGAQAIIEQELDDIQEELRATEGSTVVNAQYSDEEIELENANPLPHFNAETDTAPTLVCTKTMLGKVANLAESFIAESASENIESVQEQLGEKTTLESSENPIEEVEEKEAECVHSDGFVAQFEEETPVEITDAPIKSFEKQNIEIVEAHFEELKVENPDTNFEKQSGSKNSDSFKTNFAAEATVKCTEVQAKDCEEETPSENSEGFVAHFEVETTVENAIADFEEINEHISLQNNETPVALADNKTDAVDAEWVAVPCGQDPLQCPEEENLQNDAELIQVDGDIVKLVEAAIVHENANYRAVPADDDADNLQLIQEDFDGADESEPKSGNLKLGNCKWFNTLKGFGFITPHDGTDDVFVHQSVIQMDGFRALSGGEEVGFESRDTERGFEAIRVCAPDQGDCKGVAIRTSKKKYRKYRCYNCGEFQNHIAAQCPHEPQPKRCHSCRSIDHLVANCPTRPSGENSSQSSNSSRKDLQSSDTTIDAVVITPTIETTLETLESLNLN